MTMTKKEAQERFLWVGVSKSKNYSEKDISINRIKGGNTKKNPYKFSFTFRNKCMDKLGEKIEIAIFKNRVMFRESENGVTITRKNVKAENCYCSFPINPLTEELVNFIGDYDLKYDSFYEVYYIEKENM